jgi:hypothetical protein
MRASVCGSLKGEASKLGGVIVRCLRLATLNIVVHLLSQT